jgi:hypothetical protein
LKNSMLACKFQHVNTEEGGYESIPREISAVF